MDVPVSSRSPLRLLSGNPWEVHRFTFILLPEPGCPQPPLHTPAGNSHERVPGRATTRGLLQRVSWGRRRISAPLPWPGKPFLEAILRVDIPPAAQKKNFHFPEEYLQPAERTYCNGRPLGSGGIFISKQPSLPSSAPFHYFFFNFLFLSSRNEGGKHVITT